MGMYTWLSEQEFEWFSKSQDKDLDEILQEARGLMPEIYLGETTVTYYSWFKTKTETRYTIYSRVNNYDGDSEVRVLNLNTSNKDYVANYLFGLMNGYRKAVRDFVNGKNIEDGN